MICTWLLLAAIVKYVSSKAIIVLMRFSWNKGYLKKSYVLIAFSLLQFSEVFSNHLFNPNTTDSENGANKFFGNAERNISNDLQNFKKIFPIRGES